MTRVGPVRDPAQKSVHTPDDSASRCHLRSKREKRPIPCHGRGRVGPPLSVSREGQGTVHVENAEELPLTRSAKRSMGQGNLSIRYGTPVVEVTGFAWLTPHPRLPKSLTVSLSYALDTLRRLPWLCPRVLTTSVCRHAADSGSHETAPSDDALNE